MTEKLQIPMQTRAASVAPSTIDAEKRTVELVWSTGAAVKRMSWSGDVFIEELAMDKSNVRMGRLNGGAPLLNTHNSYDLRDVIGVVESASVDGKEGRATVRFSSRAEVDPIWKDVQDGIIRNVSVGYAVHKFEVTDGTDKKVKTMRAVDWEPMEISLVPIGADAKAGIRSEAQSVECEIVAPDEPAQEDSTQVSEQQRSENLEAEAQTGQAAPPAVADGADQLDFLRLRLDLAERS